VNVSSERPSARRDNTLIERVALIERVTVIELVALIERVTVIELVEIPGAGRVRGIGSRGLDQLDQRGVGARGN
jgi:hypothetical protein